MTTHVLLGVGGTGAKIVEAALVLFAAGVGPSRVVVGLVDQDKANGNVARTLAMLEALETVQARWKRGAPQNCLDWDSDEDAGGTVFARVQVEKFFRAAGRDSAHWQPTTSHTNLTEILGSNFSAEHQALLDMLFAPGDEEQTLDLGEGFRGRAHLGSAALIASLERNDEGFKTRIDSLMNLAASGEDVKIFLAGSAFGGTGAAGFPTLSRALAEMRIKSPHARHIFIGGALMLPYFGFADPDNPNANVVTAKSLLPQARSALEFYDQLFHDGAHKVFDRFYIAGWDPFFQLGYHQHGKRDQENPPLLPELLAALAAVEFFETGLEADAPMQILASGRRQAGDFTWGDVPFMAAGGGDFERVFERLGRLFRFAVYWIYEIEDELDKRTSLTKKVKEPWIRALVGSANFAGQTRVDRDALLDLLRKVLTWAAAVQELSKGVVRLGLWDTTSLHDPQHQRSPVSPVKLLERIDNRRVRTAFDAAVRTMDSQVTLRSAGSVHDELSENGRHHPAGNTTGLGKLVSAVYRNSRPRGEEGRK